MKQILTVLITSIALQGYIYAPAHADIINSKHNLSISGPGTVKASGEPEICIFCHTPHNASPAAPLWNRQTPGSNYTPYSSSTIAASPGQPTGASLLCLSCHDGTIALGDLLSRSTRIDMQSGVTTMPQGPTNLDTDLSDDHPISFSYSTSYSSNPQELVPPGSLDQEVKLDSTGQLQCTSCHDPHDNSNEKFLVKGNTAGALCITCHNKTGWSGSSHRTSGANWNGKSVSDHACLSCHTPHSAGSDQRILRHQVEEDICFTCHNGQVASEDIQGEFNKFSRHPISDTTGIHDPTENAVVSSRHVECMDCHNPHAARSTGTPAGPLTNVRGINSSGNEVAIISEEYQLCFRCHADSPGKAASPTTRQFNRTNVRDEFSTTNPSYHPVVGTGANPNVPSLISPLNTGSIIKCTDCHNNDNLTGPRGPHGSNNPRLLEREYRTQDPTTESASTYAMCYKCHNRSSILGNESFPRHNFHITGAGRMGGGMGGTLSTPCNVCHDPHGSLQPHLINFDINIVSQSSSGRLEHFSSGTFSGGCYLSCHGMNHNPCTYGSGGGGMGCMGGMGGN